MNKTCQIVLVGHTWQKLMYSIDKEVFDKLIFIKEKKELPGSQQASETLNTLLNKYQKRKIEVEYRLFDFHIDKKPIAEMTHLVYQLKLLGFENIIINISGGLRYINIWIYLAASLTKSRVIHGDFIYDSIFEVGIYKNDELDTIYLGSLTKKQLEFLELFFESFKDPLEFFDMTYTYDKNPLLNNIKIFDSIEEIKNSLISIRGEEITRGAINGFIKKLNRISALNLIPEKENKKKISINYMGIAFFLKEMYKLITIVN